VFSGRRRPLSREKVERARREAGPFHCRSVLRPSRHVWRRRRFREVPRRTCHQRGQHRVQARATVLKRPPTARARRAIRFARRPTRFARRPTRFARRRTRLARRRTRIARRGILIGISRTFVRLRKCLKMKARRVPSTPLSGSLPFSNVYWINNCTSPAAGMTE